VGIIFAVPLSMNKLARTYRRQIRMGEIKMPFNVLTLKRNVRRGGKNDIRAT